ncbi:MAG: hypothetical protein ACKVQK_20045 [Burkholderiales bacterium]
MENNELVEFAVSATNKATVEEVVCAIVGLTKYSESELLEAASSGRLSELFPFRAPTRNTLDFEPFDAVVPAPARAMNDKEYEDFLRGGRGEEYFVKLAPETVKPNNDPAL